MPTPVTAAVTRALGAPFSVEQLEINDPLEDEVLVRIAAVGVCHTDVAASHGGFGSPLPIVLGHEGAGVVERVGARVTRVKPGDRVVLSQDHCGYCVECRSGFPVYCIEGRARNFHANGGGQNQPFRSASGERIYGQFFGQSSFASYTLSHENNTTKVRDDLPIELLGPLGCGVLTGAGGVINVLRPDPGTSIVILGAGSVGQSAILGALINGCTTIVAVDTLDAKLASAEALGSTHRVRAGSGDLTAALRAIRPYGFDFAFDTTGHATSIAALTEAMAPRGVVGLVAGEPGVRFEANLTTLFQRGITIRGMIQAEVVPNVLIPRLADLYAAGRLSFDRLIRRYPFGEINEAIHDVHAGTTVKPLLFFDDAA
jgi:aryl-alcohol dehydrogenase